MASRQSLDHFEPTTLQDSLAIYSTGEGEPLLLIPHIEIDPDDRGRPAPVRDQWPRTVFADRLDYRARLVIFEHSGHYPFAEEARCSSKLWPNS